MAVVHDRLDARVPAPELGEGNDAACAEPLEGPLCQDAVLREIGGILALVLGAAVLANLLLILQGAG